METYKKVTEMPVEQLQEIVSLIIKLDMLQGNEKPEEQLEIVTAIQTLIRTEEAITVENEAEEEVAEAAPEAEEAPEEEAEDTEAEAA